MLEVDEGLEAGDVGVGGGQLGAQPLLLEHTTNILDGLQLIKINELKCMILKPLPIIINLRVLTNHIQTIDLNLLIEPPIKIIFLIILFHRVLR